MRLSQVFVYEKKDTLMFKLNPIVKILWMAVFSIAAFLSDLYLNLIFLIFLILFFLISKLRLLRVLASLKTIYFFLLLTLVGNMFFTPGEVIFKFFGAPATAEGLINGSLISLRLVNVFFASLLVSFSTSQLEIAEALEVLLSPLKVFKVNVQEISFVLTLTLRALMILLQETEELIKSFRVRGIIKEKMSFLKRLKTAGLLLLPLILLTLRRSEEMGFALLIRGYNPDRKRIIVREKRITLADILFLSLWLILFAAGVFI